MNPITKLSFCENVSCSPFCRIKHRLQFHKCSYPTVLPPRNTKILKNARPMIERSPQRVSVSANDLRFYECTSDNEMGMGETGDLTRNETSGDVVDPHSIANLRIARYAEGNGLDRHYVIDVFSFCGSEGCLELGRRYHGLVVKTGLVADQFVGTSLIYMYGKCGSMDTAIMLFKQRACVDVASCNCLISGYARNGFFVQAFDFFLTIDSMGFEPNQYTYTTMLTMCGTHSAIGEGKQLHAHLVKLQYLSTAAVGNALSTMYSKCGMMKEAESLFEGLAERNLISWTTMINGFYQHGDFVKALKLLCLMREHGVEPNQYGFTIALACCGSMKNFDNACMLHALVIKRGMALGDFIGTAIVDMYSRLGEMGEAEKQIKRRGKLVSNSPWNALLAGFVHNKKVEEAMEAFSDMVKNDAACDEFTYSIILKACSSLPSLAACRQIHSRVEKGTFDLNTHVGSSLIEAYTKCGSLEDAEHVFCQISAPDVVSWNSMVKAYSQNGNPRKAMFLFRKMVEEGIRPTNSTFLAVLCACSHSGLAKEGEEVFNSMVMEYGVLPEETHYSCMVDILGRAGQLKKALDFINDLPIKPTAPIWRPLLAACRCHRNLEMAEFVAKSIMELDPNDASVYVTLSNMYTEAGRHLDAEKQRRLMLIQSVTKEPGCSWIEVNNKIYRFFSGDKSHPETAKLYGKLKKLRMQIQDTGHGNDTKLMHQPESQQAKEDTALYHSEKLAVCFGLISLPTRNPIRVFKNLRVCPDCHSFMKFASLVTEREIVLRDNYRFHHFQQGHCSCGDYW